MKDTQQEKPLAYCDHCGREIYRYDMCCSILGWLVHEECALDFLKEKFAPAAYYAEDLLKGSWIGEDKVNE